MTNETIRQYNLLFKRKNINTTIFVLKFNQIHCSLCLFISLIWNSIALRDKEVVISNREKHKKFTNIWIYVCTVLHLNCIALHYNQGGNKIDGEAR